jgi:putative phosphoribosyl transferase
MSFRFQNRIEAGRLLAEKLVSFAGRSDVVVLALPRGGVPVASEVAEKLECPLGVFLVRKLGVPGYEELALGAIASGGICFFNKEVISATNISQDAMNEVIAREKEELERREHLYQRHAKQNELHNKTVVLVDDGVATGASMRAAVAAVRQRQPNRIVVALPVAARETYEILKREADEVICVQTPRDFQAVGEWYENFSQLTDADVHLLLERADKFRETAPANNR